MNKELSAHEVAKWFIYNNRQLANGYLDENVKLNKLLYFANLMFFCVKKELLLKDEFVAFRLGPVVYSIYKDYRYNGLDKIPNNDEIKGISDEQKQFLNIVNFVYGNKDSKELIDDSHSHNIWNAVKELIPNNPPIIFENIDDATCEYFNNLYNVYKNLDFSNIKKEVINGSVYFYNKNNIDIDDYINQLVIMPKSDEPKYIENIDGEFVFS